MNLFTPLPFFEDFMKFIAAFLLGATLMLLLCDYAGAEEKPTYICTSKQYQLTFGSSMQCPNIESKVRKELMSYLIWSYRNLGGLRAARDAYVTFKCEWKNLGN